MELEICLDDHHEIESALVVADNRYGNEIIIRVVNKFNFR